MLPRLCAVTLCSVLGNILFLLQLSLALPGRLKKEFGNVGSPAINGFQKNRLKLPFSPDLVLMEGEPSSNLLGKQQQEEQQVMMSFHLISGNKQIRGEEWDLWQAQ